MCLIWATRTLSHSVLCTMRSLYTPTESLVAISAVLKPELERETRDGNVSMCHEVCTAIFLQRAVGGKVVVVTIRSVEVAAAIGNIGSRIASIEIHYYYVIERMATTNENTQVLSRNGEAYEKEVRSEPKCRSHSEVSQWGELFLREKAGRVLMIYAVTVTGVIYQ